MNLNGRKIVGLTCLLLARVTSVAAEEPVPLGNGLYLQQDLSSGIQLETLYSEEDRLSQCKCSYQTRFSVLSEDRAELDNASADLYPFAVMATNAYEDKIQTRLSDWHRIERLVSDNGFSADIYLSSDQKSSVIAFRGTDDPNDWVKANLGIRGKYVDTAHQYNEAQKVYERLVREHPSVESVSTTGHSLGGGLAIHLSMTHDGVNAYTFNPSPRVFNPHDKYNIYGNEIVVARESGEILQAVRNLFTTLKKIQPQYYRYNFLGGASVKEHGIEDFMICMVTSVRKPGTYQKSCEENTIGGFLKFWD